MKFCRFILQMLILSCLLASQAWSADSSKAGSPSSGSGYDFRQKAQSKESVRWSLQDWLAQKDRNRLMDLWLAQNLPSPYEHFLKASYLSDSTVQTIAGVTNPQTSQISYQGAVGAYAGPLGLEADCENNTQESYNDLAGSLNLRVLGNANQGTHFNIRYGLRTREIVNAGITARIPNQFVGVGMNLYLGRHFGILGLYNRYITVDEATYGSVKGSRSEAGLFLDFEALRIFGNLFSDIQQNNKAGVNSSIERQGIQSGLQFFF